MLVFDLETTGLNPEQDEIIEFGFVHANRDGEIQEKGGCLVRPDQKIPQKVVQITGITNKQVEREGYPWEKVATRVMAHIKECDIICAYNASFDLSFLREHLDQLPDRPVVDPYRVAERFVPDSELGSKKLKKAARFFGVDLEEAHRAEEDAEATAELLFSMCEDLDLEVGDLIGGKALKLGKYHLGEDPFKALYSGFAG